MNLSKRIYRNWPSLTIIVIMILALTVRLIFLITIDPTYEDAFITLRYAENLSAGKGFVYNPGERVQGTTTPLFTLMLAAFDGMSLNSLLWGRLLTLLADTLICFFIFASLRLQEKPIVGLVAGLIYALAPPNINWSISGMETSLFTCLGMACFWSYYKQKYKWLAILAALLLLTRIDGAILLIVLAAFILYRDREIPWKSLVIFLLLTLPWFAYATFYFGSPLPQSLLAKQAVYEKGPLHTLTGTFDLWLTGLAGKAIFGLFLLGCISAVLLSLNWASPMLTYYFAYYALFAISGVRMFRWYLIPPSPVYYTIAALGSRLAAGWLDQRVKALTARWQWNRGYRELRVIVAISILLIFCVVSGQTLARRHAIRAKGQYLENNIRLPIGLWLRNHTPVDSTVALEPIGYIGYYSDRYIIDFVGLVSPQILPLRLQDPEHPYANIILELKPDYCVLREGEYNENFSSAPEYGRHFVQMYKPVYSRDTYTVYQRVGE